MSDELDVALVAADDALLDALGSDAASPSGSLEAALAAWRGELDDAAGAAAEVVLPVAATPGRARRVGTVTVVTIALLTGGGVAAAAVSGPHGPFGGLHRALFGTSDPADPVPGPVDAPLDDAQHIVGTGLQARGLTAAQRADADTDLDQAGRLLSVDPDAPAALVDRLRTLQAALAALPELRQRAAGAVSTSPVSRPSGSGSDDGSPTAPAPPAGSDGDGSSGGTGSNGDDPRPGPTRVSGSGSGDDSGSSGQDSGTGSGSGAGGGSGDSSGSGDTSDTTGSDGGQN